MLVDEGDGTFRPVLDSGQSVALATGALAGSQKQSFVFSAQGLDTVTSQVVASGTQRVQAGQGGTESQVVAAHSQGVLAPGAVTLADLSGDGIRDLIVLNSGGNDVLVYPGLGNGQYGPELNGGKGFFTGTDPVGVTVTNLGNGRQDLAIADKGSNDVTILFNEATAASPGFTLVQGPRLSLKTATEQGIGPVATAVVPAKNGGQPSLAVSMSGSNQVWVIPGVGGGFFDDQNPTIFPVGTDPGQLFLGNFDGTPGLATINAGSNDLTLVSNFLSGAPVTESISSGGVDPVAGFMAPSGNGFDSLVVANNESGSFALLEGGASGLTMTSTTSESGLPSPTSLALSGFSGGELEFYASTAGVEAASLLALSLSGTTATPEAAAGPTGSGGVASLVALNNSSLALVASLLTTMIESTSNGTPAATEESGAISAFLPGPSVTAGQSVSNTESSEEAITTGGTTDQATGSVPSAATGWERLLLELDEALDQIRKEMHNRFFNDGPAGKTSIATPPERDLVALFEAENQAKATVHATTNLTGPLADSERLPEPLPARRVGVSVSRIALSCLVVFGTLSFGRRVGRWGGRNDATGLVPK